jgi:hypothetical protein
MGWKWGQGKSTYMVSVMFRFPLPPRASRRGVGVEIRRGAEICIHSAENVYVDLPLPLEMLLLLSVEDVDISLN